MSIDLNELLSILGGISVVLSAMYAFGSRIAAINSKIEMHDYRIHAFQEALTHKTNRLLAEIKDLEAKLEKLAEQL